MLGCVLHLRLSMLVDVRLEELIIDHIAQFLRDAEKRWLRRDACGLGLLDCSIIEVRFFAVGTPRLDTFDPRVFDFGIPVS